MDLYRRETRGLGHLPLRMVFRERFSDRIVAPYGQLVGSLTGVPDPAQSGEWFELGHRPAPR
jgi:hypothetical protein